MDEWKGRIPWIALGLIVLVFFFNWMGAGGLDEIGGCLKPGG